MHKHPFAVFGWVLFSINLAPVAHSFELDLGELLHGEIRRKEEVCGKKYVYDMDSMDDYSEKKDPGFPGLSKIISDPHEALLAKLIAIESAQETIDMSTYIFTPDESSFAMLDAMRVAIEKRGVSVNLVVDSLGSLRPTDPNHPELKSLFFVKPGINKITKKLAEVNVVIFMPLFRIKSIASWFGVNFLKIASYFGADEDDPYQGTSININRRSHDKILLIDREDKARAVAIVGGRNIGNHYYGIPRIDEETYEDMEILVKNDPVAKGESSLNSTLGTHFKKLLCHKGNDWLNKTVTRDISDEIEGASWEILNYPGVRAKYTKMRAGRNYPYLKEGLTQGEVRFGNEIENARRATSQVLRDPADPHEVGPMNGNSIMTQFAKLAIGADKTIDIVSPYLYLTTAERDFLKAWLMARPGKRRLRILTNSPLTSDNMMAQALVDTEVVPDMVLSGTYTIGDREKTWDNKDRKARVYEFGRLDAKELGGKGIYGKLHAKYAIIDGKIAVVTSHNGDPRSRILNSEIGFFVSSENIAKDLTAEMDAAIKRSYLWGSPEWQDLINHPVLKTKKNVIQGLQFIFEKFQEIKFLI